MEMAELQVLAIRGIVSLPVLPVPKYSWLFRNPSCMSPHQALALRKMGKRVLGQSVDDNLQRKLINQSLLELGAVQPRRTAVPGAPNGSQS